MHLQEDFLTSALMLARVHYKTSQTLLLIKDLVCEVQSCEPLPFRGVDGHMHGIIQ